MNTLYEDWVRNYPEDQQLERALRPQTAAELVQMDADAAQESEEEMAIVKERDMKPIIIKDAAVGKGVFTLVQRGNKSYIHYNLPQGYILFAVKDDDPLAMEINNHLADVLQTQHGNATRQALADFAASQGGSSDPEALIEQVIHEAAYERVKHSYLFNALENDAVDRKADELAAKIKALVEQWILDEVSAEAERA